VTGALHEELPQEALIASLPDGRGVRRLLLRDDVAVARGVERDHRHRQLPVERDVAAAVTRGVWLSAARLRPAAE
jgi:hypothetical protein